MQPCSYIVMKTNNNEGNSKHKTKLILVSNLWTCSLVPHCIHIYFLFYFCQILNLNCPFTQTTCSYLELNLLYEELYYLPLSLINVNLNFRIFLTLIHVANLPLSRLHFTPFTSPTSQSPSQLSSTTLDSQWND
jgi:hypothetical protein